MDIVINGLLLEHTKQNLFLYLNYKFSLCLSAIFGLLNSSIFYIVDIVVKSADGGSIQRNSRNSERAMAQNVIDMSCPNQVYFCLICMCDCLSVFFYRI